MRIIFLVLNFIIFSSATFAQLKFVVEDFEGLSDGSSDLKANGIYSFGNIKANIDYNTALQHSGKRHVYMGERFIRLGREGKMDFGGWGKGITQNIELDYSSDFLNFYIFQPPGNDTNTIKIELQEDDNGDNIFEKDKDDSWIHFEKLFPQKISTENGTYWKLISIPLTKFKDSNPAGDGIFNIGYKHGKLLCLNFTLRSDPAKYDQSWSFDFICFSKGKLPVVTDGFSAAPASSTDFCSLGVWSKEGNTGHFSDISSGFENNFKYGSEKKLGIVHFFQPFAFDGTNKQNGYPSVTRINEIITEGYIPMITLEDHFVNTNPLIKQPNLYSITEGHFDDFFIKWARDIKSVKGIILLRILHEFNGDWYPWCIANNDKNPDLLIRAYRHIHDIFTSQQVTNVRFIWCPNSNSYPQEKWNFIMDAYPGDGYVDFVGLDIYNGAGKGLPVWRSFRKEGIENYFILTDRLPQKPLFICETASRERREDEPKASQDKTEWIRQMSEALQSDMSKIRLLNWFNEKSSFRINSSNNAQGSYLTNILQNDYFKSGTDDLIPLLRH